METPSFTFRLERVRTIRERAEDRAREALTVELRNRAEGEDMLRNATDAVTAARDAGRTTVTERAHLRLRLHLRAGLPGAHRAPPGRGLAGAGPARSRGRARREALAAAARDRQAIDKLKERRKAEHDAEWARRSQNTLDELALAVHRRGGAVTA